MYVEEMLERKGNQVYAVGAEWTVRDAAAMIASRNIGTTLVCDPEGGLLGIFSERDLVRALKDFGSSLLDMPVSELMTRTVITCAPETTVSEALSLMASHRIRHLPVTREGKILGLISVRDVLEFRLEALEENFARLLRAKREWTRARQIAELSNRAKTEFLVNVSHELKPALNTIIGCSEQLANQPFTDLRSSEYLVSLREIEQNGRHLMTIVDNLLDLSRIQIGELQPMDENLRLPKLLANSVAAVSEKASRKGVAVHVEAAAALPKLSADRRMLKQMVRNLLTNAVKFTPESGSVAIGCEVDHDGGIRITVSDTGIGIAPDNLAKVMEPFYQVEPTTLGHEGAGLGLALVNAMVQAHGGALILESKVGIGTTATLRFPSDRSVGVALSGSGSRPDTAESLAWVPPGKGRAGSRAQQATAS